MIPVLSFVTLLIGGFQQPRTQLAMNLDRTATHPVRQLVKLHPSCPFVLFVVKSAFLFSRSSAVRQPRRLSASAGRNGWANLPR